MKTLDSFKIGECGRVAALGGSDERLKRRLVDMGFIPGTKIKLCKRAPMGDPIEVNLRGYQLTLRAATCKNIEMREI